MSILRTEGIIKDYPGTRALDDVTVSFDSGKVHAFIGKNGSGKSTLVKVFAGAIQPTSGHFYLDDEELHFSTPALTVYLPQSLSFPGPPHPFLQWTEPESQPSYIQSETGPVL